MNKRICIPIFDEHVRMDLRGLEITEGTTRLTIPTRAGGQLDFVDSGSKIVHPDGSVVEIWTPPGTEWRI